LQAFGATVVGVAQTVDKLDGSSPKQAESATKLLELVPAIVIVIFAVAALILFLANGHLRAARYWGERIDEITQGDQVAGYRDMLHREVRSSAVLLGLVPAAVISLVLLGAAVQVTVHEFRPSNVVLSLTLLAAAYFSFAGNLFQSARAETS
jgi:hypothetical protein